MSTPLAPKGLQLLSSQDQFPESRSTLYIHYSSCFTEEAAALLITKWFLMPTA